jgi:hypothetical protein
VVRRPGTKWRLPRGGNRPDVITVALMVVILGTCALAALIVMVMVLSNPWLLVLGGALWLFVNGRSRDAQEHGESGVGPFTDR